MSVMLPKDCRCRYVPWICGFCLELRHCPFVRRTRT